MLLISKKAEMRIDISWVWFRNSARRANLVQHLFVHVSQAEKDFTSLDVKTLSGFPGV